MHRPLSLWNRLLSFRLSWPKRSRLGRSTRAAGRQRRGEHRLDLQPLEPKLALAAVSATSVAVPAAASYAVGQELLFNVVFSAPVTVVGTPQLDLTIGKAVRPATYLQGSGTSALAFRYTVQPGDVDADGIAVGKAIKLPTGASIVDAGSVAASLGIKPPSTKKVLVDTVAPKVQSVAGPAPKAYPAGSTLSFKVAFSENVSVTGSPTLPVDVGGTVRNAVWDGKGNGTKSLTFNTVVQAGDRDADGVRIAGPIGLSGGAGIRDAAQNAVDPAVPSASQAFPKATVDALGPSVVSFGSPVVTSKLVSVKVRFDEAVTVKGKPSIPFTLAGVPKQLVYATGSGKNELTFSYRPAKGETPTAQNVVVSSPSIALNGGAITDKIRNVAASLAGPADLALSAASIAENNAVGAVVGTFTTTDADGSRDRFTYALVPGDGSGDNASFTVDGGQLRAATSFNYEARNAYSIRVRSTDAGGLSTEKSFAVAVTNVNEAFVQAPVADGYLKGATVYADVDNDRALDWADADADQAWDPGEGEPWTKTDDQGNFSFDFGDPAAMLRTQGGIDISTGLPFQGQLSAPPGSKIVNPLTTLVAATVAANAGISVADAVAKVRTGLGIAPDIDLTAYDPIKEQNVEVQKAAAKVANVIVAAVQNGVDQAAVVANVAATVSQSAAKVDLTDAGVLTSVLTVGAAVPTNEAVANLSNDNRAVVAAGTIEGIAKAQKVSQSVQRSVAENAAPETVVHQADTTGLTNPTFSLDGDDKAFFSVDAAGAVRLLAAANYEVRRAYLFTVVAQDAAQNSITTSVTLRVTDVNEAPTDIGLSASSIAENQAAGTTVGTLSSTDPDAGNTFTYGLVAGAGDSGNSAFQIVGGQLRTAAAFDFEAQGSYSVRVRSTDQGGLSTEKVFTIAVTDVNEAPTGLALSASTVADDRPAGTVVGRLAASDLDAGDSVTYALVSGEGSADNGLFTIVDGELRTAASFNTKSAYTVRVRATDSAGNTFEKTVSITAENAPPSDIELYGNRVLAGSPAGVIVASLEASDPNTYDTFTFALVNGAGDADNGRFRVQEVFDEEYGSYSVLATSQEIPLDAVGPYSIRLRVTDFAGSTFEKTFSIPVESNVPPLGMELDGDVVVEGGPVGTVVGRLWATDVNWDENLTYALVSGRGDRDNARFRIPQDTGERMLRRFGVLETAEAFGVDADTEYSIRVRVTDVAGQAFEKTFTIKVEDNVAPTDILLVDDVVLESSPVGTTVGTLSAVDANSNDEFMFALVSGEGDTDNRRFRIVIDEGGPHAPSARVETAEAFSIDADTTYSIRVRVTDLGGSAFEKAVTVKVENDVAPTGIGLYDARVLEGGPVGTYVGDLDAVDANSDDRFTFALVAGEGDTDNARFRVQVEGDGPSYSFLETAQEFSVDADTVYSIRVRATDLGGNTYEKAIAVTVENNVAPTGIQVSGNAVLEGSPAGTIVGFADVVDANADDEFTFALVSGAGDTDNARFRIVQDDDHYGPSDAQLTTAQVFSVDADTVYSVRVRVTDRAGNNFEKAIDVPVRNNVAPTDLMVYGATVLEGSPVGTAVGGLDATDVNLDDQFTFTLVSGAGDTDNAKFRVVQEGEGSSSYSYLATAQTLSVDADTPYSVRLRVTDLVGNSFEKAFTITVDDNEAPTGLEVTGQIVPDGSPKGTIVGALVAEDASLDDKVAFALVPGAGDTDNAKFRVVQFEDEEYGPTFLLVTSEPFSVDADTVYSIRLRVTDLAGNAFEKTFTITVEKSVAPTDIEFTGDTVFTGTAAGEYVGSLYAVDRNTDEEFAFELVAGEGDTDNGKFRLATYVDPDVGVRFNYIETAEEFVVDVDTIYSFRVRVTDVAGNTFEKALQITVENLVGITGIDLDGEPVDEGCPVGTYAGDLSVQRDSLDGGVTFALVVGKGDTDNAKFRVVQGVHPEFGPYAYLETDQVFTVDADTEYSVRLRVTDTEGNAFERAFPIVVLDNVPPTNIDLYGNTVVIGSPAETYVGTLEASDPNGTDVFVFALVAGEGDTDNDKFQVFQDVDPDSGPYAILGTKQELSDDVGTVYSVRLRVTDAVGHTFEKAFAITVVGADPGEQT